MKIKTVDLTGPSLDWAVAKCECPAIHLDHFLAMHENYRFDRGTFAYSTDWSQGGPIIEREIFKLFKNVGGTFTAQIKKTVYNYSPTYDAEVQREAVVATCAGPTPLVASMRCYVASKLGDEVEIPDELISGEISPNKEN